MDEPIDAPAAMTPAQRRHEIAAILARGVLRLRRRSQTSLGSQTDRTAGADSEFHGDGLDEGAETSPHVLAR